MLILFARLKLFALRLRKHSQIKRTTMRFRAPPQNDTIFNKAN
ncbi:MAG: hypothetical protein ACJA2S_001944 [Cyclobacteriaceae bacterium]|jgi:hypothetical protein